MSTTTSVYSNTNVFCIEDDEENAEMILDELRIFQGIQFNNFINLRSKGEYLDYVHRIQGEETSYSIFVVDISLGKRVNKDGFEIINMLSTTFKEYEFIIHTAFPDERDIWEKDDRIIKYIIKSNGSEIEVAKCISDQIVKKLNTYKDDIFQTPRQLLLETDNMQMDFESLNNIQCVLNCEQYNSIFLNLSIEKRLFIADFLLSPKRHKKRVYLNGLIWELEPKNMKINSDKKSLLINYFFNNNDSIVSLHLSKGELKIVEMGIATHGYLMYYLPNDEVLDFFHNNNTVEAFLTQYFFAIRIAYEFVQNKDGEKKIFWRLLDTLSIETRRFVFLPTVWELTTKDLTKNSDETKLVLKNASVYCGIEIGDMFYGELTDIEDDMGIVKLTSVENEQLIYYRKIRTSLLEKSGVIDLNTPFRLILYSGLENSNPGDTQLIIRTTYYSKFV